MRCHDTKCEKKLFFSLVKKKTIFSEKNQFFFITEEKTVFLEKTFKFMGS